MHKHLEKKKNLLSYTPESGPSMELFKQIYNGGSKKFIIDQAGPFLYRINLDKKHETDEGKYILKKSIFI